MRMIRWRQSSKIDQGIRVTGSQRDPPHSGAKGDPASSGGMEGGGRVLCLEKKIPFLSDSSNSKKDYLRNRIRLALVPFIEKEFQPHFKETLLKASTILREEDDYWRGEQRRYISRWFMRRRIPSPSNGQNTSPFIGRFSGE